MSLEPDKPPALSNRELNLRRLKAEKFSRYFLLLVLVGIGVVFFNMIKVFVVPVMLAAVFAGIFYPLYRRSLNLTHQKRGLSALICCLILFLALLIPIYIVANLVSREAIGFYQSVEQEIQEIIEKGDSGLLGELKASDWVQRLHLDKVNWQSSLQGAAQKAASLLAAFLNKASKGGFQLLANLFLTFFAMYYFFKDGEILIEKLKYFSPLAEEYEKKLIGRFLAVSKATINGTLLIGVIKGAMGGLTFWVFGIGSPILWGVVMVLLSFIPLVGAWLVMYPAAFFMMLSGQVWQGLVVLLIAAIIVGSVDNVLGPRLVARGAGMHDLLIFFSTLGGISMFGVMGFIIGPIIAALFIAILEVYGTEFRSQLELSKTIETEGLKATRRKRAAAEKAGKAS
jgi:predicted PurR-regulated permease PerM